MTPPAWRNGFGCGAWADARSSRGLHNDVHRRGRAVAHDEPRMGRPRRGLQQTRTVAAPWLAGHQTALPALGARPVLDHHRNRRDSGGDGALVLKAVQTAAGRTSALCHAGPDRLESHQRLDPGGRRGVRRQRGADQTTSDAAVGTRLSAGVAADDPVRAQHHHFRDHRDHLSEALVVDRTSRSSRPWA